MQDLTTHNRKQKHSVCRFAAAAFISLSLAAVLPGTGALAASAGGETEPVITFEIPAAEETEMTRSTIGAAFDESYRFDKTDEMAYLIGAAAVLEEPKEEAAEIASLEKYEEIHLTGTNELTYWEIEYEGEIAYIDSSFITRDMDEILRMRSEDIRKVEEEAELKYHEEEELSAGTQDLAEEWEVALAENRRAELASQTRNPNWNGPVLSRSKGSVYGPSGKETYYNLNMSVCVRNMYRRGYSGDVWVRNDGCKMFGDYIMCAANLSLHPYGSLVESSLGTCIVVDTGGFAQHNANQLDIAVTW